MSRIVVCCLPVDGSWVSKTGALKVNPLSCVDGDGSTNIPTIFACVLIPVLLSTSNVKAIDKVKFSAADICSAVTAPSF